MLLSDKAEENKKMAVVVKYQQQRVGDEKSTKKPHTSVDKTASLFSVSSHEKGPS